MNKKYPTIFMSNSHFYCQIYSKIEFSCQMFEKYSSTKFHEIPSMCTRTGGQTDVTKLIVAFRKLTQLIRSHFSPILAKCDVTNTAVVCIKYIK